MKLYDGRLSGHCHRVRLFLSLLGLAYERVEVNLAAGEHKLPAFLALNRFGEVPVLDDDGVIVPDSNAILVYLAKKYGPADWLPEDAPTAARVQRWLSIAAGKLAYGPCAARLVTVFGYQLDAAQAIERAHQLLAVLEAELADTRWIAGTAQPSIADIALYSYIDRAPEGNVDLAPYAHVREWLRRVEALPGFLPFPKTRAGLQVA